MPLRRVHGVPEGARGRPGVLCGLPRGAEPVCGQPFCVPDAVCVLQGALAAPGAGADLGHRGGRAHARLYDRRRGGGRAALPLDDPGVRGRAGVLQREDAERGGGAGGPQRQLHHQDVQEAAGDRDGSLRRREVLHRAGRRQGGHAAAPVPRLHRDLGFCVRGGFDPGGPGSLARSLHRVHEQHFCHHRAPILVHTGSACRERPAVPQARRCPRLVFHRRQDGFRVFWRRHWHRHEPHGRPASAGGRRRAVHDRPMARRGREAQGR
mmetsp:Transcript_6260/g.24392  ORF Transcript_6260/g.24392 Transcript_6260/m.24392 type:complete len:266 (+) Transcript_6260:295-1092(+)